MAKTTKSDIEFIEALAELLNSKDLGEIEILREYGDNDVLEVRISKTAPAPVMQGQAPQMMVQAPAVAPAASAPATSPAAPLVAAEASAKPSAGDLSMAETSPMVGTVYLSPEPGAQPFVKVGDSVEQGQTIVIIEAMKTMNQIPAAKSGTVTRILVDDASPVEFGDPLIVIE